MPIEHVFFFKLFGMSLCHLPDSSWKWAIFTKPQYSDAMSAHPALSPRKAGLKEQGYSMLANKWGPWDRGTVLGSAHRFEHVSDQAQLQGLGVAVLAL